jgi:hypothetical protein
MRRASLLVVVGFALACGGEPANGRDAADVTSDSCGSGLDCPQPDPGSEEGDLTLPGDAASLVSRGVHCELTWTTPGDANQRDSGPGLGADMDLHFLHPLATGSDVDGDGQPDGWFDPTHDLFWANMHPTWETSDPAACGPSLDLDDTDGSGPENTNVEPFRNGGVYRVGVHYWDEHGFGPSRPRVKCHMGGTLVIDSDLEALGRSMHPGDLWEVATFKWPQGIAAVVLNTDGTLKITPNYSNPNYPLGSVKPTL